eukprot:UN02011
MKQKIGKIVHLWNLPNEKITTEGKQILNEFDALVLVGCDRIKEDVLNVYKYCGENKITCAVVRNKVDKDVANELEDNKTPKEETLRKIKESYRKQGFSSEDVYLVSSKKKKLF